MKLSVLRLWLIVLFLALVSTTRSKAEDQHFTNESSHAAFVITNAADKNEVISYRRAFDGTLRERYKVATGGRGSGGNTDPLESQGSLTLSQDKSLLFAANAGSGEISVFRVLGFPLSLTDIVPAGGSEPDAIAQHGNLVYVLNAGGSSNVVGFRLLFGDGRFVYNSNAGSASIAGSAIHPDGSLTALPGTVVGTHPTGATNLDIAISSDGTFLYTLNSGNGTIGIFAIQRDGSLVDAGSKAVFCPPGV